MKSRLWLFVVAVLLSAVGCRNTANKEKMERELRFQEDRIYQLEDWVRQYHDQLDSCRSENQNLRTRGATDSRSSSPVRVAPFDDSPARGPKLPDVELPKVEVPSLDSPPPASTLPVPKIPGMNKSSHNRLRDALDATLAADNAAAAGESSLAESEDPAQKGDVRLVSFETGPTANTDVVALTLNQLFTTGLSRNKRQGDVGVMVLVEPRNSQGALIPPTGELSVAVIDPAATTEAAARVARWDFTAAETARHYRHSPLGDGIRLDLLWPDRPPVNSRLKVFARLIMLDGREVMAQRTIAVKLAPGVQSTTTAISSGALVPVPETPRLPIQQAMMQQLPVQPATTQPIQVQQPNLFEVRALSVPTLAIGPPAIAADGNIVVPTAVGAGPPAPLASPTPPITVAPSPANEQVAIPVEGASSNATQPPLAVAPAAATASPPLRTSDSRPEWTPYR